MYLYKFYMPKINYMGPCKCMLRLFTFTWALQAIDTTIDIYLYNIG